MSEATPIGSGRYGLLGTLSTTLPRIVRHRGIDTILDRDVTILVLTDATLHRDNVLESASRAVLVEDQRLQQVYDVERAEPSVIVTEPLTGRTFSSLVSRGMPPAQARAIIGETAQALDAGARRGLHHLNLSPESIRVLPDGTVKVSGLGIEAAALDLESRVAGHDPSAADRADARSLVEILYYGLTGRVSPLHLDWAVCRSSPPRSCRESTRSWTSCANAPGAASPPSPPLRWRAHWAPGTRWPATTSPGRRSAPRPSTPRRAAAPLVAVPQVHRPPSVPREPVSPTRRAESWTGCGAAVR